MFKLDRRTLSLIDGSLIRYEQLAIPACSSCNSLLNDRTEKPIQAVLRGDVTFDDSQIAEASFYWLTKVMLGLYMKESSLMSRPGYVRPDIPEEKLAQKTNLLRDLLRGVTGRTTWDVAPASLILVKTSPTEDPFLGFDFMDGLFEPFVAMRLNSFGIIAVLTDWSLLARSLRSFPWLDEARRLTLSPIQFREVATYVRCVASSRISEAPVVREQTDSGQVHFRSKQPTPDETDAYEPFDAVGYGAALAHALQIDVQSIGKPNGIFRFLRDENGRHLLRRPEDDFEPGAQTVLPNS